MGEHKLSPLPPRGPAEGFVIHESAIGKSFPIREATDEQLAKHMQAANAQHEQMVRQAMSLMGQATNIAKAAACIAYEIDRRSRTLKIVGDLSDIRGPRQ